MLRTVTLWALLFALIALTLTVQIALRDLRQWADDFPDILAMDRGQVAGNHQPEEPPIRGNIMTQTTAISWTEQKWDQFPEALS